MMLKSFTTSMCLGDWVGERSSHVVLNSSAQQVGRKQQVGDHAIFAALGN